jgi:hypothetical protein
MAVTTTVLAIVVATIGRQPARVSDGVRYCHRNEQERSNEQAAQSPLPGESMDAV